MWAKTLRVLVSYLVLYLATRTARAATLKNKSFGLDLSKYAAIYYDPVTGVGLAPELENSGRDPSSTKVSFRGLPCHCENTRCTCCAGINLTSLNFNRRACTKFTYEPSAFAVNMAFTMNDREVYSNTFSAKNPPPLCAPVPYLPFVNFCIRFFDLHTEGRNLHACIDLETRIVGSPILTLHFDCVKVGIDGISWTQIGNDTSQSTLEMHTIVDESEVYDEVEFEQQDLEVYANYTSTLSPEEEAQIGQLKLRSTVSEISSHRTSRSSIRSCSVERNIEIADEPFNLDCIS
ncbi:uncharacterized protein LOC117217840 [Megalopta genalis]|uniref:uncharacterized protein LOC117217840 n=1 Tax=Megalopta genalis TaxID=115081 RepID=UPI003FD6BF47